MKAITYRDKYDNELECYQVNETEAILQISSIDGETAKLITLDKCDLIMLARDLEDMSKKLTNE